MNLLVTLWISISSFATTPPWSEEELRLRFMNASRATIADLYNHPEEYVGNWSCDDGTSLDFRYGDSNLAISFNTLVTEFRVNDLTNELYGEYPYGSRRYGIRKLSEDKLIFEYSYFERKPKRSSLKAIAFPNNQAVSYFICTAST